ncbi:hypothetical protein GIY62_31910 [Burkholderia plantarii]|uniref:hypothetical protein n=1 Tax=Burkholderia plantarii TaxID=41899 RepID=UPI00272B3C64|nr:hypothetical protein [Burkholderia plantarii]WLE62017.1 hypothetical protein GIY62_31910 [Burkholderia plantarii]
MNAVRIGVALLTLSVAPGAHAQFLSGDALATGAPMLDNAATTTVPSVIRPIVGSGTHRVRLGVKVARSYETRQVTDLEKAWGSAGPGTLAGTVTTRDSGGTPGNLDGIAAALPTVGLAPGRAPGSAGAVGFAGISGFSGGMEAMGTMGAIGMTSATGTPRSLDPGARLLPSGSSLAAPLRSSVSGDLN